jgi:hypothetical protein
LLPPLDQVVVNSSILKVAVCRVLILTVLARMECCVHTREIVDWRKTEREREGFVERGLCPTHKVSKAAG